MKTKAPVPCVNWARVFANMIIAFCTTLLGTTVSGLPIDITQPALITAVIVGMLALGTELKQQTDDEPPIVSKIRNNLLVF